MLSRFGPRRALPQALAVLLLITGWTAPLAVPHSWDDDPICVLVQGAEAAGASRISGSVSPSAGQADHCVLCHTARSFRSAFSDSGSLLADTAAGHLLESPADLSRRSSSFVRLPARGPPA